MGERDVPNVEGGPGSVVPFGPDRNLEGRYAAGASAEHFGDNRGDQGEHGQPGKNRNRQIPPGGGHGSPFENAIGPPSAHGMNALRVTTDPWEILGKRACVRSVPAAATGHPLSAGLRSREGLKRRPGAARLVPTRPRRPFAPREGCDPRGAMRLQPLGFPVQPNAVAGVALHVQLSELASEPLVLFGLL